MNKSSAPKQFEDRPRSTDVPLPGSVSTWCNSEHGWQAEIHTINGERITGEYRANENDAKYSAWTTYRKMLEQMEMSEGRAEYKPKPYLYLNGRVDVEALQELERRVATLEAWKVEADPMAPGTIDNPFPRFTATLEALIEKHNVSPTTDTSREYYEQQIEEISGKWQAAEEKYKTVEGLLSEVRSTMKTPWDKSTTNQAIYMMDEVKRYADTIAELREKFGAAEAAVIAYNMSEDAKLGALMSRLPAGDGLYHIHKGWMSGRSTYNQKIYETALEALEAREKERE